MTLRLPGTTSRGPLLKPAEAAAYLGVSDTTLNRWSRAGFITSVRTPGGHRRYYAKDLDRVRERMYTAGRS